MTPRDYREAWAWVHLFLNGPASGKAVMASCLNDLHQSSEKVELWQRMAKNGGTTDRLLAHLKAVPSRAIGVEQASTEGFGSVTRPSGRFADQSVAAARALAAHSRMDWILNRLPRPSPFERLTVHDRGTPVVETHRTVLEFERLLD